MEDALHLSTQDLKYSSSTIQADLDRFQRQKVADLREMAINMARSHREWCKKVRQSSPAPCAPDDIYGINLPLDRIWKPGKKQRRRLTLSQTTQTDCHLHPQAETPVDLTTQHLLPVPQGRGEGTPSPPSMVVNPCFLCPFCIHVFVPSFRTPSAPLTLSTRFAPYVRCIFRALGPPSAESDWRCAP